MAVLADLEVFHSRPIAPTRRVALGSSHLPVDPAPGFGGILLGGIVASTIAAIDPDLQPDLLRLTVQLEEGQRIVQPRLRYRFQTDRVGLMPSRFRLVGRGEDLAFDFDAKCLPAQAVLGAVYAAGTVELPARHVVMSTIRRAMRWTGSIDHRLIAELARGGAGSPSAAAFADPVGWAMEVLGFGDGSILAAANGTATSTLRAVPARREVLQRFRELLREAHPDHGGRTDDAARRIADLTEARRILLRS